MKDHFQSHFNKKPPEQVPKELFQPPEFIITSLEHIDTANINGDAPTELEVKSMLLKLKMRKSTTDTPADVLQTIASDPESLTALTNLYKDIWEQKRLPQNWKYTCLKALFKNKGSTKDPSNYRGISVSSTQLKVLCMIILSRISDWYDDNLLEGQYGFRPKRGCQDAIYCLKRVQQISYEKNEDLFVGFADLKAAFDWVPRDWMFTSIKIRMMIWLY